MPTLEERLDALEEKVDELDEKIDDNESRITDLEGAHVVEEQIRGYICKAVWDSNYDNGLPPELNG